MYGAWTEDWGRGATRGLLAKHPDVDAILCGSDQIARGCLDALRESGREVPQDVAVMGHDNWEVLATNARPALTSIDMNLEELGRRAAARLFEAMEGNPAHGVETIPCRLALRSSTAASRSTSAHSAGSMRSGKDFLSGLAIRCTGCRC